MAGGDRQAGIVPTDQHHEEVNVGAGVQAVSGEREVQHAAELRLRGPRAQVLEEHHVHCTHLWRRRQRLSHRQRRTCE